MSNLPSNSSQFEAERNAGEARDGLLQFESEQLRARLAEIEELLRNTRQQLDSARDRRGDYRLKRPSCNPICNIWPIPASTNSELNARC